MKMNLHYLIIILLFNMELTAQETVNVLCVDFKKNGEEFSKGKEFRLSFESVLSNLNNAPRLVEREKLGEILLQIQNEENLQKDFNRNYIIKLNAVQVDYLIYGSFYTSSLREVVEFRSECVKISRDNTTSKLVFPTVNFTEKELSDFTIFEVRVKEMLKEYSFVEGLGIVETKQLEEINKKLVEKDQQIKKLEDEVFLLKSGNSYKILFNGNHLIKKDASTSMISGTEENKLFEQIQKYGKEKQPQVILTLCDKYISENPYSNWWTPHLAKGVALLNLGRVEEGFQIFEEIIDNVPGEEDYMVSIASIYKKIGNKEKFDSLMMKLPNEIRRIVEAKVRSDN